jgi:hypothetical protein
MKDFQDINNTIMKNTIKLIIAAAALGCMISCKDSSGDQQVGKGAQNTEDYNNEQGQSEVTETGQRIGNHADSTTVDGEAGNRSNN